MWLLPLLSLLPACQKEDSITGANETAVELERSMSRISRDVTVINYQAFIDAVKNDPDAPQVLFDSTADIDLESEVGDYLNQMWTEFVDDGCDSTSVPTSWTCIKLMFNDDPDDDCPVRTKPQSDQDG